MLTSMRCAVPLVSPEQHRRVRVDITLTCSSCGQAFVFSAGEQELQYLRGFSKVPKLCPICARRAS